MKFRVGCEQVSRITRLTLVCILMLLLEAACFVTGDLVPNSNQTTSNMDEPRLSSRLSVGSTHSCLLRPNRTAWCWGNNTRGQLGLSGRLISDFTHIPSLVSGLDDVSDLSAGHEHSCAVNNGDIYCWGDNTFGQLGIDPTVNNGYTFAPQKLETESPQSWKHVSAGGTHSCALTEEDQLWCWGDNIYGQTGQTISLNSRWAEPKPMTNLGTVDEMSVGFKHTCVLSGEAVICWGQTNAGKTTRLPETDRHTWNLPVFVPLPAGAQSSISTATGKYHSCAISESGSLSCWGSNENGQLGYDTGSETSTRTAPNEVLVGLSTNKVSQVSLGARHSCALTFDHEAYCWGWIGPSSQLNYQAKLVQVSGLVDRITQVEVGQLHSCFLTETDAVYCSGNNDLGQAGQPTDEIMGGGMSSFLNAPQKVDTSFLANNIGNLTKETWGQASGLCLTKVGAKTGLSMPPFVEFGYLGPDESELELEIEISHCGTSTQSVQISGQSQGGASVFLIGASHRLLSTYGVGDSRRVSVRFQPRSFKGKRLATLSLCFASCTSNPSVFSLVLSGQREAKLLFPGAEDSDFADARLSFASGETKPLTLEAEYQGDGASLKITELRIDPEGIFQPVLAPSLSGVSELQPLLVSTSTDAVRLKRPQDSTGDAMLHITTQTGTKYTVELVGN